MTETTMTGTDGNSCLGHRSGGLQAVKRSLVRQKEVGQYDITMSGDLKAAPAVMRSCSR